ncbi:MAG: PTS transporter subunit EIIC [Brevinema sp.]
MKKTNFFQIILGELQKIGQALVLPIAVLPIAGLLLRLGQPDLINNTIISEAGLAIFKNLALLFAIGISGGLAKDRDVSAGLAGATSYLILVAITKSINPENDLLIFGGVLAGFIGGYTYNAFHLTKLPVFLAFFGGRRFVPIMSGVFSVPTAMFLGHVWPSVSIGIANLGNWITSTGAFGLFFYGFFNRLLIPFGLQHIIEKYAYFALGSYTNAAGEVFTGDLNRFFAGDPTAGIFMSGFFPVMIFGLPAAALAMYLCVPKEKRNLSVGLFASIALTSLLTGVTEPIEFSFLFVAPILFVIHAGYMGLSYAVSYLLHIRAGFTFSGGIIDLVLSWKYGTNPGLILLIGIGFFVLYFITFYALIKLLNLKTPGLEVDSDTEESSDSSIASSEYTKLAPLYIEYLGGKENVKELTNCVTRLRLKLNDPTKMNEAQIKKIGSKGIISMNDSVQIIIGTDVEFLATEIKKQLNK